MTIVEVFVMTNDYIEVSERKVVLRRLLFTCFILAIFIFGNRVVLLDSPGIDTMDELFKMNAANFGASYDIINVFSLGLGPWLTAMIFTSLYYYKFPKKIMKMTRFERSIREKMLALLLSIIQAIFLVRQAYAEQPDQNYDQWLVILILVTGSMMLIWFADLNAIYGIAGAMPIVFISIIKSFIRQSSTLVEMPWVVLLVAFISILIAIVILLILELSEYRLQYEDIMTVSEPYQKPFVAWKLNPSGSLSIMIAISLFLVLRYVLDFIVKVLNGQSDVSSIIFSFTNPIGIFTFIIMLFLFNYWLSIFMLNPKMKAEMFEKSGNYFHYIRPGKDTEKFIMQKARIISLVGASVVTLIIGVPLFMTLLYPKVSVEIYLAIQVIMIVYIGLNMNETVRTMLYFDKYEGFFKKYW